MANETAKGRKAKTVKYIDLISQSSKDVEKQQLEFRAKEASHTVNVVVLETEKEIFETERQLTEAKAAVPYNLQDEIDLTVKLENLNKGLKIALEIQKTRF